MTDEEFRKQQRKGELRRKKKSNGGSSESSSGKGILKRNNFLIAPDFPEDMKKTRSEEVRSRPLSLTKFDSVKKPWSSLKDQPKNMVSIPRRSRSLTEGRRVDKSSGIPFKSRVTSALKPKTNLPSCSKSDSPLDDTSPSSIMTTITSTLRNKTQRFQSPHSECIAPPRIEITDDDFQKSILKPSVIPEERKQSSSPAILHRVVTFSIPPGRRRTSVSSLSSSTPDLRSVNEERFLQQETFDSEVPKGQCSDEQDVVISELLRQSNNKDDVLYWIQEKDNLMKEIDRCLLKLRGVMKIIEGHLIRGFDSNSYPMRSEKKKKSVELSEWQVGFLNTPKSYTFPYLCERTPDSNLRKSWPSIFDEDCASPLKDVIEQGSYDFNDFEFESLLHQLSSAKETSILAERSTI